MPLKSTRQSCVPQKSNRQQGVSLLESLVALLVLALGVLGMLGVQLKARTRGTTALALDIKQVFVETHDTRIEFDDVPVSFKFNVKRTL